ncbi:class IIb bacteriocin, lactobin A/cerein 7B family [Streptococcus thoraltensis]
MTNFNQLDNMSFVALSETELVETGGGIIPVAVAASVIAGSAFAGLSAGVAIGISRNRRP